MHAAVEKEADLAALEEPGVPAAAEQSAATAESPTSERSAFDHRFYEARMLENDGDVDGAIAIYRELALENPADIRVRNNLGCLYEERGQGLLALEQYEAARALAPDNVAILLNVGGALVSLSRFEQAERELRRAQKLDPSRADVHTQLGTMFFKRGLYANAEIELKRAVELDPESGNGYFYRGESLNQLGRVDEALESLERAVQLQPNNARAYYVMGLLFDRKGWSEQATAMYRKAREAPSK